MNNKLNELISLAKRFPELDHDEIIRLVKLKLECEKVFKALEIIVEKNVNIYKLKICDSLEGYNKLSNTGCPLTKETYELLKEIL